MIVKSSFIFGLIIFLTLSAFGQKGRKSNKLESNIDSVSYAIGILVGTKNLVQLETAPGGDKINKGIMAAAFHAASVSDKEIITPEQANELVRKFFEDASSRKAQKDLEEGIAFLEKNKVRVGVTTTESGLQYEILTAGTGLMPTVADQVRVHYHGTLINGKVFDSSVNRGEPVVFGVGQVIPGWTEALQLMPIGSKWKIYLPSNIAYGERGAGSDIGPNAALIFEVELLEIVKADAAQ